MDCECGTPAHYIAKRLCRACYQRALKAANPEQSNCVPCCTFHNFAKWRLLNYNQMRAAMNADQIPCSNIRPTQRRVL